MATYLRQIQLQSSHQIGNNNNVQNRNKIAYLITFTIYLKNKSVKFLIWIFFSDEEEDIEDLLDEDKLVII